MTSTDLYNYKLVQLTYIKNKFIKSSNDIEDYFLETDIFKIDIYINIINNFKPGQKFNFKNINGHTSIVLDRYNDLKNVNNEEEILIIGYNKLIICSLNDV